jgi:hypothetical protein
LKACPGLDRPPVGGQLQARLSVRQPGPPVADHELDDRLDVGKGEWLE